LFLKCRYLILLLHNVDAGPEAHFVAGFRLFKKNDPLDSDQCFVSKSIVDLLQDVKNIGKTHLIITFIYLREDEP
jgi:hypothetical protein